MPRPKKKTVDLNKDPNDGRRNNGGNDTRPIQRRKMTPAKLNKAKKERIRVHANQAIINIFGGEQEFWNFVAEKAATGSTKHLDFLGKFAFPDPGTLDGSHSGGKSKVPVIQFFGNGSSTVIQPPTQDIDYEDEEE